MRALLSGLAALMVLAGCGTTAITPIAPEFSPPKPLARTTPYTKPLACLGDLYNTYSANPSPLLVGVMPANDATGASQATSYEVPREFTLMVEAAVNSVSPRIRLINVDHEFQVRENAVGGKFQRVAPKLLLKPGISEFDRGLAISTSKKDLSGFFGKGRGATDFSVDRGVESASARIGVDMIAYEYGTMSSIPHVHASVGAEVDRKGINQGWSLSIYGWGIGNTVSNKAIQARHEAVRVLTEYAVLQTLGRYLRLPYWRCVEGMEEDMVIKQSLSGYHQKLDEKGRVASLQELLQYHGFAIDKSGVVDEPTQEALSTLKLTNPDAVKDKSLDELYYQLYVSIPVGNVPDARGWRLVMPLHERPRPKAASSAVQTPAPQAQAAQAPAQQAAASPTVAPGKQSTQLQLQLSEQKLARGDKIQASLSTNADTFVYCYLQEASGEVKMLYPNRFAPSARLAKGQTLSLPGAMRFSLVAHPQGKEEQLACVATNQDLNAKLPLGGKDFVALPVASVDEMAQKLKQLSGAEVSVARVKIRANS
jgi:hypothetical protein